MPSDMNKIDAMGGLQQFESRAKNTKRDNDSHEDNSYTLIKIDETILNYINNTISPKIIHNGVQVQVPVIYASPEKWVAIQASNVVRDANGKIQCPAMTIRRTSIQKNDSLAMFNRYLSAPIERKYSEKNRYDPFNLMTGFAPRREIYMVNMPNQMLLTYDCIVWTEKTTQMSAVIEAINWAANDYWGTRHGSKFRVVITDYQTTTDVQADNERMLKCTFSMQVYAYLLPERRENQEKTTTKIFTARKIVIEPEVIITNAQPCEDVIMLDDKYQINRGEKKLPNFDDISYTNYFTLRQEEELNIASASYFTSGSTKYTFIAPSKSLDSDSSTKLKVSYNNVYLPANTFNSYVSSGSIFVDFPTTTLAKYKITSGSSIFIYGPII